MCSLLVWPDLEKFRQLSKLFGHFLSNLFSIWQDCEPKPTLASILCFWAIFNCSKWPNIEKNCQMITLLGTHLKGKSKINLCEMCRLPWLRDGTGVGQVWKQHRSQWPFESGHCRRQSSSSVPRLYRPRSGKNKLINNLKYF